MKAAGFAALLAACAVLGGCVIIVPAIPGNVPGYGRAYHLVDETGGPAPSGLLILDSTYEMGPYQFTNCYAIENGAVQVPRQTAVRYGDGVWGATLNCIGIPLGYFGWFQNPKFTTVLPLAPGYILEGSGIMIPPDKSTTIRLTPADADAERKYLLWISKTVLAEPSRQTESDKAARRRALEYIDKRLGELAAGHPG